jgi:hypothetical protein
MRALTHGRVFVDGELRAFTRPWTAEHVHGRGTIQSLVPSEEVQEVLRRLHRFHEGVLGIGELVERTLFVIDPITGRPVFPGPLGVFDEENITLHAPEDEPGALMVLGRAVEIDPGRDGACDRWLMYHGKPRLSRWAAMEIESIKSTDKVLDREEAQVESPLRSAEPALCRWINKEHARELREVCRRSVGTAPQTALLVGVDPYGMDVRAHFGVMRVEFDRVAETEAAARAMIEEMIRG